MKKMTKKAYEMSALDKKMDKKYGYKEGSKKDAKMDAMNMLKLGMMGKKLKAKKK